MAQVRGVILEDMRDTHVQMHWSSVRKKWEYLALMGFGVILVATLYYFHSNMLIYCMMRLF